MLATSLGLTIPTAMQGLVIIGAPSNEFGGQEPGSNSEIKKFAKARGADFPMLGKLKVNGSDGEHSPAQQLQMYATSDKNIVPFCS